MNYFAHGLRFIDRPYFLAGTALPDWLSVVDRSVRLRAKAVSAFVEKTDLVQAELAAGVLQHLDDDRWFHKTRAFAETSGELTRLFRGLLGPEDGFRPGFLGHIVLELVLDAVLIERDPDRLDAYYKAVAQIDPADVERAVNQMAPRQTDRLAWFIPLFSREQFLRDYTQPERLLTRLNQVMQRIKLKRLPDETVDVLREARLIVGRHVEDLLPAELYAS